MSRLDAHEEAVRAAYLQGRKDMREEAAVCADKFVMLPADECNVPFDKHEESRIKARRAAAARIASTIRELKE